MLRGAEGPETPKKISGRHFYKHRPDLFPLVGEGNSCAKLPTRSTFFLASRRRSDLPDQESERIQHLPNIEQVR